MAKKTLNTILRELENSRNSFLKTVGQIEEMTLSNSEKKQASKIISEVITHSSIAIDEITI